MFCIDSQTRNPYYNLAAEEYFLRESNEEFFILWESDPSVIVGKHQNTLSEINYRFISRNGIQVARRLSGGGTVFHGRGNLNYTFIRNGKPGHLVNFSQHIEPVIRFLKSLGMDARKGPRHEILVNGLKISGNAEHVYKNRVLHHGTLLFSADLETLRRSIKREGGTYSDRSVQSNRAEVTNISTSLHPELSLPEFRQRFYKFIRSFPGTYEFLPEMHMESHINKLMQEKYTTWEWIYGWSPDYIFSNSWTNGTLDLAINIEVHRGIITRSRLVSKVFPTEKINSLFEGLRHSETEVNEALQKAGIDVIAGKGLDDLVCAFF